MITALYIGAAMDLNYSGAEFAQSGAIINNGNCTWELADAGGTVIGSGSLVYVAASDGDYYGQMPASVTSVLTLDAPYTLTILFSVSGTEGDERVLSLRAAYRTAA